MWVRFYRNNLPLFGDHTTNRVERQFWSLKTSLAEHFTGIPTTSEAIIHLSNCINERLSERAMINSTKRYIIFDSDDCIRALNKEASRELNERGCMLFHKSLKMMNDRRPNLTSSQDGVMEKFQNGDSKLYTVTQNSCICTYNNQFKAPCFHILFYRERMGCHMFDVSAFDPRYHRKGIESGQTMAAEPGHHEQDCVIDVQACLDYDSNEDVDVLTDHEKYRLITPILTNIGNLVSCYSTKAFLN